MDSGAADSISSSPPAHQRRAPSAAEDQRTLTSDLSCSAVCNPRRSETRAQVSRQVHPSLRYTAGSVMVREPILVVLHERAYTYKRSASVKHHYLSATSYIGTYPVQRRGTDSVGARQALGEYVMIHSIEGS